MTFTMVQVRRTYLTDTAQPATGTVQVSFVSPMTNGQDVADTSPVSKALDSSGSVSFTVPAVDDLGTSPAGNLLWVVEAITGKAVVSYYISVPTTAAAGGIDLATATKLATPSRRWVVPQPLNQRGLPGGYPSLDGTGKVPRGQLPDDLGGGGSTGPGVSSVNGRSGDVVLAAADLSAYTKAEADARFATSAAAVDSVNGKTGTVVLNSGDVGSYSQAEADAKFALATAIPSVPVTSVAGKTGAVTLSATDVGALSQAAGDARYVQPSAIPVTSVNGKTGDVVLNSGDTGSVPSALVGAASGVAALDAGAQVPLAQVPGSVRMRRSPGVRRIDLSTGPVTAFSGVLLGSKTVGQGISVDYVGGFLFTSQLMKGGIQLPGEPAPVAGSVRATNGDMCITKLSMAGTVLGSMYVTGGGHGMSVGVEYGRDGQTYLWIDRDASSSGYAQSLSRIQFADGTVLDSRSTASYAPMAGMQGVSCSVDPAHRLIAVRWVYPTPDTGPRRMALYDLDQAIAGIWNPLSVIDQAVQPGTNQGFVTWGSHLYLMDGDSKDVNPAGNMYIQSMDWTTGQVVQRQQITYLNSLTFREPEGLAISLPDPSLPHRARLYFGIADGASGSRNLTMCYIAGSAGSSVDRLDLQDMASPPSANPVGGGELYSYSGHPMWRDPSGRDWQLGEPNVTPGDHGFISWTYDPAPSQGTSAPTAGTLYLGKQTPIYVPKSPTKVWYAVATAGSGLTAGQCFVGLYNASGVLLATSADQSTAMASTGVKSATLISPPDLAPGVYYVGILANGTTAPVLARGSGTVSGLSNANLSPANYRFGTSGTTLTALPSSVTMTSLGTAITGTFWSALS